MLVLMGTGLSVKKKHIQKWFSTKTLEFTRIKERHLFSIHHLYHGAPPAAWIYAEFSVPIRPRNSRLWRCIIPWPATSWEEKVWTAGFSNPACSCASSFSWKCSSFSCFVFFKLGVVTQFAVVPPNLWPYFKVYNSYIYIYTCITHSNIVVTSWLYTQCTTKNGYFSKVQTPTGTNPRCLTCAFPNNWFNPTSK